MSRIERLEYEASLDVIEKFRMKGYVRNHEINMDEPQDLGGDDTGLSPVDLLLLAAMSCQSSSLSFCMRKRNIDHQLNVRGKVIIERDSESLLRVSEIDIFMKVEVGMVHKKFVESCVERFRKYCMVAGSIEKGIPINTHVEVVYKEEQT
jgi:uncharacterized OsmC-like protein